MSLSTQFITMIVMFGSGIYLGLAIDTFRRFERYWKRNIVITYALEILFWILQGLVIFYFLFIANQGELRLYIFLSILCGYAAYQSLIRSTYLKVLEVLIQWAIAVIRFGRRMFILLVYRPIQWVILFIIKLLIGVWAICVWLFWILLKILWFPIRLIGRILWWFIPKNAKNYLKKLAGIYSKIKNTILKWWTYIQNKRR